ncbi:hypothetical protein M5D96_014263 [Drosophila gunungcola]|uniref:Uncharacterized protein n=1 Tax=Drosophila gunungcola TaxID=103775 RepID=A0A9P9YAI8_9MUSC|nr:hypothetical protein M5D96_014263 [Drosophila gunungcola]
MDSDFSEMLELELEFSITQTRKKQILIFVHKPPVSFCTSDHEYSISEFFMELGLFPHLRPRIAEIKYSFIYLVK